MRRLKKILFLAACFGCASSPAATIRFSNTNSVGQPDTNAFRVIPISTPINADGTFIQTGIPLRLTPNASGIAITNLAAGNYVASNAFLVNQWYGTLGTSKGIAFAVPSGSGTYEYSALALSQGGPSAAFNVFNYNGQAFSATASNILYALGLTNILDASTITNMIVASSNAVSSVSNSSTNLLSISTNLNNFALTIFAQTNGYSAIVFTNPSSVVMTNFLPSLVSTSALPALTNQFALTNQSTPLLFTNDANRFTGFFTGKATKAEPTSSPMITILGVDNDLNFTVTGSQGIFATASVSNALTSGTSTNALNVASGITNRWKMDATNAVYGIAYTNTIATGSGLFSSTGATPIITFSVAEGTTNRFAFTNYVFNVSNNVVTASNSISIYALGISNKLVLTSNRFDLLFPTNSGTDGQLITKSGTNVYWSTVTGGSGTGVQTNAGSGTNNYFVELREIKNTNIVFGYANTIGGFGGQWFSGWGANNSIVGGFGNQIALTNETPGGGNFIGGGTSNWIKAGRIYQVIGGGLANVSDSDGAVIAGGAQNSIGALAQESTISGGLEHYIQAAANYSLIAGGHANTVTVNSVGAAILGGELNVATGNYSTAAGYKASATNRSTFVWNDGTRSFGSATSNIVVFGASNGVGINTNNPSGNALNAIGGGISATNFNIQGDPFIYWNTNVVSVRGAGSIGVDGTYVYLGNRYTNYLTGGTITNNSGTWVMLTAAMQSAYSFTGTFPVSTNWTPGVGIAPSPRTFFGGYFDLRGFYVLGDFDSTNLAKKYVHPTNAIAAGSLPYTVGTGGDTVWTNAASLLSGAGSVALSTTTTNVSDLTGRAFRGAFLEPIDTNKVYIIEVMNTNVASLMLLPDNLTFSGSYIRSGNTFVPEDSPTAAVIYKTNLAAGAWVMLDLTDTFGFGPTPMFWMTNGDASLNVPLGGTWYSDANNIDPILGASTRLISQSTLQHTNTVSFSRESYKTIQHHNSPLNTGIRGGRPVVMIVAGNSGELTSAVELTNLFRFLTNNSLESFPDIVEVDNWAGGRDSNQNLIFTNTVMAGFTNIGDFTSYVHSQGKLAALHFDAGIWSGSTFPGRIGSQPFFYQDSTNAISHGLDGCILDTSLGVWEGDKFLSATHVMEFVNELHAAAGNYGRPFYLMGGFNGRSPRKFEDWMPSANSYCLGDDVASDVTLRNALKCSSSWRGFGKYITTANTEDTAFTGSANGARNLFGLVAIGPFNLQCGTNTFTASVRAVCTNSEMKAIWFDAACNPGWLVTSNATGEVWTRLLANGDYAVMFDNITGSAASMSVDWRSLGIETNITLVCRDVFERTNITANTSLTTTVPKTSLWRFSFHPLEMSGSGSPEGAVNGTVGSRFMRTDGSGGLYIKTNGVGNTGWYNLLTQGP